MSVIRPRYVVGDGKETELPYPEGNGRGPDITSDIDPVGRKGRWTLTGMSTTHKFYSAALIYHAGIIKDPVEVYWAERGLPKQEAPYILTLDWVAFKGLPSPADRTVFAVPTIHAPGLISFLNKISVGRDGVGAWDSLHQLVPLVDKTLLANMTVAPPTPPTVPVSVYGLTGPGGTYYWHVPSNLWKEDLCLAYLPPKKLDPETGKPRRRPMTR